MTKVENIKTVDPRQVAEKLDAVRNFLLPEVEDDLNRMPRLAEALWFLAWVSLPQNYKGGLARFTADFIAHYKDKIGPRSLVGKGRRNMSPDEIEEAFKDLEGVDFGPRSEESRLCVASVLDSSYVPLSEQEEAQLRMRRMRGLSFDRLHEPCIQAAHEELAGYFFDACTDPETRFFAVQGQPGRETWYRGGRLWFWPQMWECLVEWMDARANKIRESIAKTSVTKEIFRWLELAEETRKGVMFVGNSRYGKTEAIKAYAEMYPGRVRLIETPDSSAVGDLLREVARSLGISYRPTNATSHELRTEIDFVLRQSHVMMVFDEAQALFPTGGKRSDPPRLNFVRRAIMDIGLPTAFVCTPQSWKRVERNYLKASGYSIEQFEGRLLRSAILLPDDLPREELTAVARIHFPDLPGDHVEYIVRLVRAFQGSVLSCFQNVAAVARKYAAESGRQGLKFADIKRALSDVLPGRQATDDAPALEEPLPVERETAPIVRPTGVRSLRPETSVDRSRSGQVLVVH